MGFRRQLRRRSAARGRNRLVAVKIRYKSYEAAAKLHPRSGGALIRFREPQRAVTPGQAAVFYDGDILLGGGTIEPLEAGPMAGRSAEAGQERLRV